MACEPGPISDCADGLRVAVRVTPKGRRDAVTGLSEAADGTALITAGVRAPPEGGKANAALVTVLARAWCVPKRAVRIVAGSGSRRKVVHVAGDPAALRPVLDGWLAGLSDGRRER